MKGKRGHEPILWKGVGCVVCQRCGRLALKNQASIKWWAQGCPWDLNVG